MENKLILKRVMAGTMICAAAVFAFEEGLVLALGEIGLFLLIYVLTPARFLCQMFGLKQFLEHSLDRKWFHFTLAVNALLWAVPFAVVYRGILSSRIQNK